MTYVPGTGSHVAERVRSTTVTNRSEAVVEARPLDKCNCVVVMSLRCSL
jgi:hypothetical protein